MPARNGSPLAVVVVSNGEAAAPPPLPPPLKSGLCSDSVSVVDAFIADKARHTGVRANFIVLEPVLGMTTYE